MKEWRLWGRGKSSTVGEGNAEVLKAMGKR